MRAPIPPRPHPDPSRADEPGPAGDTEDVGLPAQVSDELVAAGLAVGEPMGRDRSGRLAPRRALDPDGRDVVVQIVDLSEKAAGARTLRRLADLRSLRNDAIAPVRQVLALPGDRVGVVSDLIAGADLAVVLGARGGLTRSEAARLLDDLGGALAHMHERGMAHGDVAAANVIVSTDGRPVLIDLLGGVLETGTPASAAPERKAGAPATAAADVYSLAALLRQCAAGSPALAERLERVLPDALDPDPTGRPSARDLAARAPEIGLPGVIELPDGARLAAGALRAASSQPTRAVASRRGGACDRRPVRRWGRRSPSLPRRRGARLTLAVLVLAVAAGVGMGAQGWIPGTASGRRAAPVAEATLSADQVETPGSLDADAAGAQSTDGGDADADGDMLPVVVQLSQARDTALNEGDAQALMATTVPDSPAALADESLMTALTEAQEHVEGLDTMVSSVTAVQTDQRIEESWPGATAVRVSQFQGPSARVGADGSKRTVPAQERRDVILVLVPDPWRVAEILQAD